MSEKIKGILDLVVEEDKPAILRLNPIKATFYVGEKRQVELTGGDAGGTVTLRDADGARGSLTVHRRGLVVQDAGGHDVVRINCEEQALAIGGNKHAGAIMLRNGDGDTTATISSDAGGFSVGGSLRFQVNEDDKEPHAVLRVGDGGRHGVVRLRDKNGQPTVIIDGGNGDISLPNGDCAEDFDVALGAVVDAGMVVVMGDGGGVQPCSAPYDTRVVGVVSGAGSFRPGIVLDRRRRDGAAATVGLMGKVYCLVDADPGPIRPGALLTTSARTGHAQVASDRARAFGTVLGKALDGLTHGQGLIPVLVNLH